MRYLLILGSLFCIFNSLYPDIKVPSIFSSGMVLQRNQVNPIWGWSDSNTEINISFAGDFYSTVASQEGYWKINLLPKPANALGQVMVIQSADESISIDNVLFGEVWLCSGQSNMQWSLLNSFNSCLLYTSDAADE